MEEKPSCYIGLRSNATNEDKKIWICDEFLKDIVKINANTVSIINTISILQIVFIKFCEFAGTKYSMGVI